MHTSTIRYIRKKSEPVFDVIHYEIMYKDDYNHKSIHKWIKELFPKCNYWRVSHLYVFPLSDVENFELTMKLTFGCEIYDYDGCN